ncbi:hypothetical protein RMN57_35555 [Kitasatospora sp. CM 4170]|uniref:Integral membrane protein n=2 Tax=Kitasatospora aburaviensis TaxID=67265 RepID=A0ABW1F0P1_9ACTN|nr:hypothetical protein [Kitasatospora sp. CM 4170]WNM49640.1 hypothetical protein RMN57_35555 [Kitasatospora sp. CM 4170]
MMDASLTNLRNRASGLLSIATLITSFSTTLGFISNDGSRSWLLITLTTLLIATPLIIGALAILIPKPRIWYFCPSGKEFLQSPYSESAAQVKGAITRKMIRKADGNRAILFKLSRYYRAGLHLLLVEVALVVWISVLPK